MPLPTAPAAWSPPPAGHRRPRAQARRPRRFGAHPARDLDALRALRHPRPWDPGRVQHLLRPRPMGDIEKGRAAGVGHFRRVNPGQLEAQIVLGQQDLGDFRVGLRLVVAQPDDLRGREPGQDGVADVFDEVLAPDLGGDPVALGLGALVAPEQGGPQDLVVPVQKHRPVHLAAEADAGDLFGAHPRLFQHVPGRADGRVPPVGGVLLGPQGAGRGQRVLLRVRGDGLAFRRDQQRFSATGAVVQSEIVGHKFSFVTRPSNRAKESQVSALSDAQPANGLRQASNVKPPKRAGPLLLHRNCETKPQHDRRHPAHRTSPCWPLCPRSCAACEQTFPPHTSRSRQRTTR